MGMKIKTSELKGAALDWAVAKCEGYGDAYMKNIDLRYDVRGKVSCMNVPISREYVRWCPSTNWSQCGPIIEREEIEINVVGDAVQNWCAIKWPWDIPGEFGKTPLIAAMRCYVASKLGNEVDVPDELL